MAAALTQRRCYSLRPKKNNCLFPVTVQKNRVDRLVKKISLNYFFAQKCVFYACFTLIGRWMGDTTLG